MLFHIPSSNPSKYATNFTRKTDIKMILSGKHLNKPSKSLNDDKKGKQQTKLLQNITNWQWNRSH